MLRARLLHASALATVADVVCDAPRGGCGTPEHAPAPQVIVPRRGVFAVHRGRRTILADPVTAVVLADEYAVSHPADGGDRCVALTLAPELHEEAFGDARVLGHRGRLAFTHQADALAGDEQVMHLVAVVAGAPALRGGRRVQAARERLGAAPTRRWTLGDLARETFCSPYHLARQFRAATGQTITAYLLSLRLALALDRLAEGEDDLARLAADLGFASHSHFTERFRAAYGTTPSKVRTILTAGRPARA